MLFLEYRAKCSLPKTTPARPVMALAPNQAPRPLRAAPVMVMEKFEKIVKASWVILLLFVIVIPAMAQDQFPKRNVLPVEVMG